MVVKIVAVVGAGASGIAAVKACLDEGLTPVCYEQSLTIGGLWFYRDDVPPGQGCVAKTTTSNTSKELTSFSDFPMLKHFPNYPHNRLMLYYLQCYVARFALRECIRFQHEVISVTPSADYHETGRWMVTVKDRQSGEVTSKEFDSVMICNGHFSEPNRPRFDGEDVFKGRIVHTLEYRDHRGYEDKTVVVVGIGNTGCDISVDLSMIAKKVYVSTRRGQWVMPRNGGGGLPIDVVGQRRVVSDIMALLPARFVNAIAESKVNKVFDHDLYNLRPNHRFFELPAAMSDDLPNRIASGAVTVKPGIARLTATGVEFVDGSSVDDVDVVILATGYTFRFPFLDQSILTVKDNVVDLYRRMFPPHLKHPTLAVVGRVVAYGSLYPIFEIQSRWATRVFKGLCRLPCRDTMLKHIRQRDSAKRQCTLPTLRNAMTIQWVSYLDELAADIGCRPNIAKLMLTDPTLGWTCYFGPAVTYQYRLQGPGKWSEARETILTTWERIAYPLNTEHAWELAERRRNSNIGSTVEILFWGLINTLPGRPVKSFFGSPVRTLFGSPLQILFCSSLKILFASSLVLVAVFLVWFR